MFGKKNLGKTLKSQAKRLGACDKGLDNLERLNEQELINRYVHFIDFAISAQFPSNDFIKENFSEELLHHNNIYVDSFVERRNARQIVVIQGKSYGNLYYDGYNTADVYVRHDSDIVIDCTRMSKIFISVYDNAKVKVVQRDGASVYVYTHGDKCKVETEGEVLIRKNANNN
jgi:hypothetical protein